MTVDATTMDTQPTVATQPTEPVSPHDLPTELVPASAPIPAQPMPAQPMSMPPVPAPAGYPAPPPSALKRNAAILVPLAIGAGVALTLGVYGQLHEGTGVAVNVAGFSEPLTVKVWLTSGAALLAVVQLFSALVMWGKLPVVPAGKPIAVLHRWSGRAAFLLTVPVAVHCLYALGFQSYDTRVLIHSLLGCLFFGAFTTKMLILPKRNLPGWTLPVVGGLVFTVLVCLWLTSSLWYFSTNGLTF
jgi:hypothetical protein